MKRWVALLTVIAAALAIWILYLWLPGSAPPDQPALVRLAGNGASGFREAFDADAGMPRVVLLLSPT